MAKFDFEKLDESGVLEVVEEEVSDNQTTEEVVEVEEETPAEETAEEEEVIDETVEDTEVEVKKQEVEKTPYTEAEIQEILKSDGEIDTSRLSPAEQATMKAMQRGFTPKLQEAAELRREVEQLREMVKGQVPEEQPSDIYQAYDQDPEGVLKYVDSKINELAVEGNIPEVRQLEALKYEFNRREIDKLKAQRSTQGKEAMLMSAILEAVPDLATKQGNLREYAINELGYTVEELAAETDPSVAGERAVRNIIRINHAYDKHQALTSVKKKRVKKPTPVEKPSNVSVDKPDVDELKQAKEEALKTGNFRSFFEAMGEN